METEEEFAMGEFLRLCATTANEEEEPRKGRMNFPLAFPSLFCCFRQNLSIGATNFNTLLPFATELSHHRPSSFFPT